MDDPTPTVDAPSKPPLRFRRTRIAVSVFFGVLTVALCVLWVRSYWMGTETKLQMNSNSVGFGTSVGILGVGFQQGVAFKSRFDHRQFEFDDVDRKQIQKQFSYGFGLKFDSSHQVIFFPFWLAVLGSFSLGWISWGKLPNRHSFQFSLRTMLIATTLVAFVLGLGVWLAR